MIIVIKKQSFPVFPLKRLGLMLIFIISIWYLIGLNNNNYSLIFDLKSILLIILTSLIAFISVENPSRVKRIFDFFCKLLVPLALMNMITSIPGINLFNNGWGVGRYGYVFIFGYLYYLVKVLFHNNRDIFAILSLAIFFLSSSVFPLQKTKLIITLSTTIVVIYLWRKYHYKNHIRSKSLIRKPLYTIIAVFLITSLYFYKTYTANPEIYNRIIIDRFLRGWDYDYLNIKEAFTYQILEKRDFNELTSGRFEIWKATLTDIKEKPLFGHGIGYFLQRNDISYGALSVHNLILYLIVSFGLVGNSLLFIGLLPIIPILLKALRNKKNLDLKVICISMLAGSFVFNLVDIMLSFYGLLIISSICFGVLVKVSLINVREMEASGAMTNHNKLSYDRNIQ
tara:strand:+ start:25083 stop:26273 length:1191 start_codon:yes stop_codon:yes gene_type:complete